MTSVIMFWDSEETFFKLYDKRTQEHGGDT